MIIVDINSYSCFLMKYENKNVISLLSLPVATNSASRLVKICKNVEDYLHFWKTRRCKVITEIFGRLVGFHLQNYLHFGPRSFACINIICVVVSVSFWIFNLSPLYIQQYQDHVLATPPFDLVN